MSTDLDRVAEALPGYEVGDELGRGAWGIVLAGRHKQLGREVAIKQLLPALAADVAVRARFDAEARLIAALDHPHIVPVFDYVEHDGLCLLVMERLTGGTVADRFEAGHLTPEAACASVLATSAGLHHAHRHSVLHRDVKPQNLMFSADGVLKVTDFGMAEVVGGSATLATPQGDVLGTPAYMAPEQAQGEDLGPPTDVYGVATVLYQLLSGQLPFSADGRPVAVLYRHVHEDPRPLSELAPEVPDPVASVAMRGLSRQPEDRYQSAEEFGVALAQAATQSWGPGWLERTGVGVAAVGPILAAAMGDGRTGEMQHVAASSGNGNPPVFMPVSALAVEPPSAPVSRVPATFGTPPPVDEGPPEKGGGGRNLGPILAAAAGALVVLALGLFLLLQLGGDDTPPPIATPTQAAPSSPAPAPTAAPAPAPAPGPVASWRALRDAPTERQQVAVAVDDGTIWVIGGLEGDQASTKAERYDPAIDTWAAGPELPIPLHHAMAVNYQGNVIVMGGWSPVGDNLTGTVSDRVFALQNGQWVEFPKLNRPRAAAAAAVVDDKIVLAGGQSDGQLVGATEVYDGSSWTDAPDLPTPREHVAAASDGQYVYVVGGRNLSADQNLGVLERFDPGTNEWESLPPMPTARGGLGAAVVEGRLIAVGGEQVASVDATVEAYDVVSQSWEPLPGLGVPRHGLGVAAVGSSLYAIDGAKQPTHAESSPTVEVLNVPERQAQPVANWEELRVSWTARQQVATAVLGNKIWIFGGLEGDHSTPRAESFDPTTNAWEAGVDLPLPLHHAMAVTYRNELVVLGGWLPEGDNLKGITSDRVFALRNGQWTELPRLNRPRAAAAAAVVGDRIVLVGGQSNNELEATTEVFDGSTWTDAAPIPTPREHVAAAADDEFVYVVGGRQLAADHNSAALERYNPATDTWEALAPMPTARGGLAAAIISGRLVAIGGEQVASVDAVVEAYDIATGTWSSLPDLNVARHGLAAATIGTNLYALNGATQPTHAESSAATEVLEFR